jgi:hypothetical protein
MSGIMKKNLQFREISQTRKTKEYHKKSSESFVSIMLICCQILSPWLGDIVASGIALLFWPASLCSLAGRYDNPMPESTISPSQGLRIWLQINAVFHLMYEWCFVLLLNGKISSCYIGRLYLGSPSPAKVAILATFPCVHANTNGDVAQW